MPIQTVSFRRKTVVVCFVLLTIAFVVMGIILGIEIGKTNEATKNNETNIQLIQESRVEACEKTLSIFRSLFTLSINDLKKSQNGNLTKEQKSRLDKYMGTLDPKQCEEVIAPPLPTAT